MNFYFVISPLNSGPIIELNYHNWRIITTDKPFEARLANRCETIGTFVEMTENDTCKTSSDKLDTSRLVTFRVWKSFQESRRHIQDFSIVGRVYYAHRVVDAYVGIFRQVTTIRIEIIPNEYPCSLAFDPYGIRITQQYSDTPRSLGWIKRPKWNVILNDVNVRPNERLENYEASVPCLLAPPPVQRYFTVSFCLKYSPNTALTVSGIDSSFRAFRSWSRAFTMSSDMATIGAVKFSSVRSKNAENLRNSTVVKKRRLGASFASLGHASNPERVLRGGTWQCLSQQCSNQRSDSLGKDVDYEYVSHKNSSHLVQTEFFAFSQKHHLPSNYPRSDSYSRNISDLHRRNFDLTQTNRLDNCCFILCG